MIYFEDYRWQVLIAGFELLYIDRLREYQNTVKTMPYTKVNIGIQHYWHMVNYSAKESTDHHYYLQPFMSLDF